ncbi:MAG: pacearchaeosortase [Candidatus Nanoarchaeia archaeon]
MKRGRNKPFLSIFLRYIILIVVAIPNLWIFYFVFTPLTLYPVYFLFNFVFGATLVGELIKIGYIPIKLIRACVAGSAYYLLLILNLSIQNIKLKKRLGMIGFAFLLFLILNIIRIFLMGWFLIYWPSVFDFTHKLFWYLLSIGFVIGIWFLEVRIFKIKEMPFYSDVRFLYEFSFLKRTKIKNKKLI